MGGCGLAERGCAVVARGTSRSDSRVDELRAKERRGRRVASFAGRRRGDMCRRFSGCQLAVVAGRTAGCDCCALMHERTEERRCALVTSFAGECCWHVRRRRLALRRCAVVAGGATRGDSRVDEFRAKERRGRRVACLAGRRRGDMCRRFSGCQLAVVAGHTAGRDRRAFVDEPARERRGDRVTSIAGQVRRNVGGVLTLHTQHLAVVARRTISSDAFMIEGCTSKRRGALVAGVARLVGCDRYVIGRFWRVDSEKILSMAGRTCTRDGAGMREFSACERYRSRVAGIARLIGDERRNMIGGLTLRRHAMTA